MCTRDLDDVFAYTTNRKLLIRDRRLGLLFLACQVSIACYVLVYQIILRQAYLRSGTLTGLTRLQLKRPDILYQWPDGDAPYCFGGTANSSTAVYTFPAPGRYKYESSDGLSVTAAQAVCTYADARFAVPNPGQPNAIYLPTRTTIIHEAATPRATCESQGHSYCGWKTVNSSLTFLADAEAFTLLIDHSFSSDVGLSKSSVDMIGHLIGTNDEALDPCVGYDIPRFRDAGVGCPSFIGVGDRTKAVNDIVSMRTLLNAAGIESLDEEAGKSPSLVNSTKRYAGVVLMVTILYSNHYLPVPGVPFGTGSFDTSVVQYAYRVRAISEQEYKAERVFTQDNEVPNTERVVYNDHGIYVSVSQSGSIGIFDFQALLINLTTALGLLSLAVLVTDFIAFNVITQRFIFRQYATRKTVDMSDVLDAEDLTALKRFEQEEDLVDPLPKVFEEMLNERSKRMQARQNQMAAAKLEQEHHEMCNILHKAKAELESQLAALASSSSTTASTEGNERRLAAIEAIDAQLVALRKKGAKSAPRPVLVHAKTASLAEADTHNPLSHDTAPGGSGVSQVTRAASSTAATPSPALAPHTTAGNGGGGVAGGSMASIAEDAHQPPSRPGSAVSFISESVHASGGGGGGAGIRARAMRATMLRAPSPLRPQLVAFVPRSAEGECMKVVVPPGLPHHPSASSLHVPKATPVPTAAPNANPHAAAAPAQEGVTVAPKQSAQPPVKSSQAGGTIVPEAGAVSGPATSRVPALRDGTAAPPRSNATGAERGTVAAGSSGVSTAAATIAASVYHPIAQGGGVKPNGVAPKPGGVAAAAVVAASAFSSLRGVGGVREQPLRPPPATTPITAQAVPPHLPAAAALASAMAPKGSSVAPASFSGNHASSTGSVVASESGRPPQLGVVIVGGRLVPAGSFTTRMRRDVDSEESGFSDVSSDESEKGVYVANIHDMLRK